MIQTGDLRAGNYVKTVLVNSQGKKEKKILLLSARLIAEIEAGKREVWPIELMDAWLLRFGFTFNESFHHFLLTPAWLIHEKEGWYFMQSSVRLNRYAILYVHQFQNMFYAFTGEDLLLRK